MPQIDNVDAFVKFLSGNGISSELCCGLVYMFKPLQSEGFDDDKIAEIANDITDNIHNYKKITPIIVSSDGYVIDGHHRYLAAVSVQSSLPYIQVDTTANKLLKMAYEYSSTN